MALHDWTKSLVVALIANGLASPLIASPQPARDGDEKLLQQVLALLPDDKRPTVPIRFVNPREMGRTSDPGAFTLDNVPAIYVSNQTAAFDLARRGDRYALAVLASCIWHEEQHVRGRGEVDAYNAQIELVMLFVRTNRMSEARGEALVKTLRGLRSQQQLQATRAASHPR